MNVPDYLSNFEQIVLLSFSLLQQVTEEQSMEPYAEGKWTKKEVIGHLIDSASNNHQRFVRMQLENNLSLPNYDGERWVQRQSYITESWLNLITLWKTYNLHLMHLIVNISEDKLENKCTMPESGEVTLQFLVEDCLEHMKHHLQQIL